MDQVRDGSTIRVYLLPEFQHVQVFVAGIQVCVNSHGHSFTRVFYVKYPSHSIHSIFSTSLHLRVEELHQKPSLERM